MQIEMYASTDVGSKIDINEDAFLLLKDKGLIVVCDGMGGPNAGDVASQMAVATLETYFQKASLRDVSYGDLPVHLPYLAKDLIVAIRLANRRIFQNVIENQSRAKMGTTIAALLLGGNIACIAHVGDSRVYRIRNSELQQLTKDHPPFIEFSKDRRFTMEEVNSMVQHNTIPRLLGIKPAVSIDLRLEEVQPEDTFLVCSDGLTSMLSDKVMLDILLSNESIERAGQQLVEAANMAGSKDNITVGLAQVKELDETPITLLEPGEIITIPDEDSHVQEHEDKLMTVLLSGTQMPPVQKKVWLKPIALFFIVLVVLALFLYFGGKITGPFSNSKIAADDSVNVVTFKRDSIPAAITTEPTNMSFSQEISGHLSLEVFPYSDSVASAYEIAVDGLLISSFADLRQSGLILSPGEHTLDVCLNGNVIYSKKVTVNKDGEELQPLRLESVIQQQQ